MTVQFSPIGSVRLKGDDQFIEIEPDYRPGLVGLDDFNWIILIWHADKVPALPADSYAGPSPYTTGPERLGVFATRSPMRPNPVCVTVAMLTGIDHANGILRVGWIDLEPGSPILDIKPYQPAADRVDTPSMPAWCAHWPQSIETSGDFDWASIFKC